MDAAALVGSWTAESADAHLEFKADGTYIRVSSFVMPMTYEKLALDDEGTYSLEADRVTFAPTSGHYRRNGVDEGFDDKVRVQAVRLEAAGAANDLYLDDGRWMRDPVR